MKVGMTMKEVEAILGPEGYYEPSGVCLISGPSFWGSWMTEDAT
jgi:hypothetical protein